MPEVKTKKRTNNHNGTAGRAEGGIGYLGRLVQNRPVVVRQRRSRVRYSEETGKLTLAVFYAALEKQFPRLCEGEARRVWEVGVELFRQSLLDGHGVTLEGVGALIPYVKAPTRSYHPGTKKVRDVPPRRAIKVRLAPAFAEEFVPVKE